MRLWRYRPGGGILFAGAWGLKEVEMTTLSPLTADARPIAEPTRRDFLYIATATVGSVGAAAIAWPLIDQMNPDAATVAAGGPIDVAQQTDFHRQPYQSGARQLAESRIGRPPLRSKFCPAAAAVIRGQLASVDQARIPYIGRHLYASWLHPQIPAQARSERSRSKLARRLFLSLSWLEI